MEKARSGAINIGSCINTELIAANLIFACFKVAHKAAAGWAAEQVKPTIVLV